MIIFNSEQMWSALCFAEKLLVSRSCACICQFSSMIRHEMVTYASLALHVHVSVMSAALFATSGDYRVFSKFFLLGIM